MKERKRLEIEEFKIWKKTKGKRNVIKNIKKTKGGKEKNCTRKEKEI